MSAPYWGKLPAPKPAYAPTNPNSRSDDYSGAAAAQEPYDDQPRQRPHRVSVQTTNTEAPTESTFSPFASPTTESFVGQGLAPRPPSYQHSTPDYPPDIADRRAHRRTRTREDFEDLEPSSPAPPAAPDVPRGPPLSYRPGRYSNSSTPDPYAAAAAAVASASASRAARASASPPVVAMSKAQEPPPARAPPDDQREYLAVDHDQENIDPAATPRTRVVGELPLQHVRTGSVREATAGRSFSLGASGQPRKPQEASQHSAQRRVVAHDRSPLQKLERTLKEEKRAKVEAAERRARERSARNANAAKQASPGQQQQYRQQQHRQHPDQEPYQQDQQQQDPQHHQQQQNQQQNQQHEQQQNQQQQQQQQHRQHPQHQQHHVRFRERSVPEASPNHERAIPSHRHPPQAAEPLVAAHRGPLSQNPPAETSPFYDAGTGRPAVVAHPPSGKVPAPMPMTAPALAPAPTLAPAPSVVPAAVNPRLSGGGNMGLPKRNLSFRERAARQDIKPPSGLEPDPPAAPTAAPPRSSGGFSLSRSNSNKLRKDPPGDPWYRLRLEAQNAMHQNHLPPQPQPQLSEPMNGNSTTHNPPPRAAPPNHHHEEMLLAPAPEVRRMRPDTHPEDQPQDSRMMYTEPPAPQPQPQPGMRRHATEPIPSTTQTTVTFDDDPTILRGPTTDGDSHESDPHFHRELTPGDGLYLAPKFLDEWRQGTTGSLEGALLDLHEEAAPPVAPTTEANKAWWENNRRKKSISSRPRRAEAFDGEYAETNGPTRFKPPLYLECGPLLRYCGIRRELAAKSARNHTIVEREIWRGSIMIVTRDTDSSYDIAPTLRLFLQPLETLPPPPVEVNGELSPEYVDPIAGHPKLGRRGETVYVRPVEHLEEGRDLSRDETDDGLYEASRSPPDVPLPEGVTELPGSYASRYSRIDVDGEKVAKYKDVRGFRLHAERGHTFWRFNIEVELAERQQRVAYRINRGPALGFWVPAKGTPMNVMFHSGNGFGTNVDKTDDLSGPDPLWRDVLNNHQTQPFHVMVGGGGQIFNDTVVDECTLFRRWSGTKNDEQKYTAPFMPELQDELEYFYLRQYCRWFSQGLFSLATSQIPMVNMYDDHEILDGYGSYPRHVMNSPVFGGLGAVAFKYYMLFQHQSVVDETEASEPSWILGVNPGPSIREQSRSLFMELGTDVSLLAVDCRTERTEDDVIAEVTWEKIMDRCYKDIKARSTKHLLVVLPVPIAYPRMVWLEKTLGSRLMSPFKKLGRSGMLGNAMHQLDGDSDIRDDLNDHWTAKSRTGERRDVIEQLQDLAAIKSVRVTILSGGVNLAAVGQFYSHQRFQMPKHKDFRYMPNVVASPIANCPPPNILVDMLNKGKKAHHFDKDTDEDMIPMFPTGVEGKPRNNKRLLPHRNWCSIRLWAPGNTPPSSPTPSIHEEKYIPPPSRAGSLFRRLSRRKDSVRRPNTSRGDVSRPPVSASASSGLFRSFSRRNSNDTSRPPQVSPPGKLQRSMSANRPDFSARRLVGLGKPVPQQPQSYEPHDMTPPMNGHGHGHSNGHSNGHNNGYSNGHNNGHSNGHNSSSSGQRWVEETEPYGYFDQPSGPPESRLRGGGDLEYEQGDEALFTARPARAPPHSSGPSSSNNNPDDFVPRPFHRTPTGLSTKQRKRPDAFAVDLEGGLDITLNVEVNPLDPAGITVPYRLLVPRLFHDEDDERRHVAQLGAEAPETGFKRFLSFRKKQPGPGLGVGLGPQVHGEMQQTSPRGEEQGYQGYEREVYQGGYQGSQQHHHAQGQEYDEEEWR